MSLATKKWAIRGVFAMLTVIVVFVFLFFWTLKQRSDRAMQAEQLLLVLTIYAVHHEGVLPSGIDVLEHEGYVSRVSGAGNQPQLHANLGLLLRLPAGSTSKGTLRPLRNVVIDLSEFTVAWGLDIKKVNIAKRTLTFSGGIQSYSEALTVDGQPIWLLRDGLYDPEKEMIFAVMQVEWVKNIKLSLVEQAQAATQVSETDRKNEPQTRPRD